MPNMIQEFPTTHVLIDDNINYLRGLSTILPLKNKIYRYFTDPLAALNWINNAKIDFKPNSFKSNLEDDGNHRALDIDVDYFHQAIYSEDRFDAISTIIVDFDMPCMSGIELCQKIKNPNIQKILLTGFLGEKDARHALNKGFIDMFLPKGEDSSQKIAELIFDANQNYFAKNNQIVDEVFKVSGDEKLLKSECVKNFFSKAHYELNAAEYYLLNPLGDYFLIDSNGSTLGLSIQDRKRINENIELAKELGVPRDIIKQLELKKVIFCYHDQKELPQGRYWKNHIFDAISIDTKEWLIGACHKMMFSNKGRAIKPFKPVFDKSIQDAIEVLQ